MSVPTADNRETRPIATAWLCMLATAWIVPGLLAHDPWKPDEAYTFGIAYSILNGGGWIVPQLADEAFVEKPPLFFLSAAFFAWLCSPPLPLHDAARVATGFYMALAFLFIGLAARELYGGSRGALSVLTLMGCVGILVRGHQLITDISLLTGFAIGYYGFALALRRPLAGGWWLGVGTGVGFLSKGLIAPGILGVTALLLLLFPAWRTRNHFKCTALAAAVCVPCLVLWPLALYRESPALFHEWLWVNNFGRFTGDNDLGPAAEALDYLGMLPWYALPALPLAAWVLWRARRGEWRTPPLALPLTGFAVTFTVLSVSADARELYAMPMLLPLALLASPAADTLRRGAANLMYWFSIMGGGFVIVVAWFYWGALELGVPARLHAHLHRLQPGYTPGFRWLPFTLGVLYTLGWIMLVLRLGKCRERPIIAWAASITMLWGLLGILFVGWVDAGKSYRSMISDMQQSLPPQYRCIASLNLGEPQRAMLHYVADIITYNVNDPERRRDCDLLLVQGSREEQVPPGDWYKIWEGARPGDKVERYRSNRRTAK